MANEERYEFPLDNETKILPLSTLIKKQREVLVVDTKANLASRMLSPIKRETNWEILKH